MEEKMDKNNNLPLNGKKRPNLIPNLIAIAVFIGLIAFLEMNKFTYTYEISTLERAAVYAVVAVSMTSVVL